MSTQPTLFDVPISRPPSVNQERDRILARLTEQAGEQFRIHARRFVLQYLAAHGATSGEALTEACRAAGIHPAKGDDRAFGPIYMALARLGQIVKAGAVTRAKGHHTNGGTIWQVARGMACIHGVLIEPGRSCGQCQIEPGT